MKNYIQNHPCKAVGLALGLLVFFIGAVLDFDLFEELVKLIALGESFELDEIIIPAALYGLGAAVDVVIRAKNLESDTHKVLLYNQMNAEVSNEITVSLTRLLEFRTAFMNEAPDAHDLRHELDRMIVTSFNHFERTKSRGEIDSKLLPLVFPNGNK